jgi:D-alanine-D-alanine ligase
MLRDGDHDAAPHAFGLRPKGYLSGTGLAVVLLLTGLTLAMVLARLAAAPGMPGDGLPGLQTLRTVGAMLNHEFTLEWIPTADRDKIIYLALLPTAALLITVARLTLGLRVLGYRSILVAVGFREIGVLPGLLAMGMVLGVIVALRPTLRRVRLPLYARVSMILGITACLMVGALFLGSWLRSELVWSLAFFPVVVVAMMAEAIAGTLDQRSPGSAAWRLGWTLVLAFVLLAILNSPTALGIALRFPELMLTQLMGIVLVSEYLDLRLLQDWNSNPRGLVGRLRAAMGEDEQTILRLPRVAVVRNRWHHGVIARLGPAAPARRRVGSVQHLVDALRDEGYAVKVLEGDMTLLRELAKFLPPHPRTGAPGGVVLNLASGIQGRFRNSHVPAMLEMAGIAYTGPDPQAHARLEDRLELLWALQRNGLVVPAFQELPAAPVGQATGAPPWRLVPRYAVDDEVVVARAEDLPAAIAQATAHHGSPLLLEAWPPGPEYRVAVLDGNPPQCLPILRTDDGDRRRACPAPIEPALAERLRDAAMRAFRVTGCRDLARVDLRLQGDGTPCVLRVQAQEILARRGALADMAEAAGLGWSGLLRQVVEHAAQRCGAEAAGPRPDNVVPLPAPARAPTPAPETPAAERAATGS